MSEEEGEHQPSAEQKTSPDHPEPRLERRWRPASVAGPAGQERPAEKTSPPNDPIDPASAPNLFPESDGQDDSANGEAPSTSGIEEPPLPTTDAEDPPPSSRSSTDVDEQARATESSSRSGPSDAAGETPAEGSEGGDESVPAGDEESASPTDSASDNSEAQDRGRRNSEETPTDNVNEEGWSDSLPSEASPPPSHSTVDPVDDDSFFTDETRRSSPADQVEDAIQEVAYQMNEGKADTDWTPSQRRARRIATTFALLVSKVAEDMSYERRPGDEFWDPRKIMRRQIDNRPLQHCKMDYAKRRLALLVDTSPSCTDEAVFYSKVASGAMLRDDIDIFLCPNGHIDAQFDPEPMRFVDDDRGYDWDLEGRTVLYFTDWDGSDQLVAHSKDCNLYWFDNCSPETYWESTTERHRQIRLRYRGRHFHCPDPEAFQSLVRKIRP